jgi:hypothetical protein
MQIMTMNKAADALAASHSGGLPARVECLRWVERER